MKLLINSYIKLNLVSELNVRPETLKVNNELFNPDAGIPKKGNIKKGEPTGCLDESMPCCQQTTPCCRENLSTRKSEV